MVHFEHAENSALTAVQGRGRIKAQVKVFTSATLS